jgi:pimeloyl-ACP methyl ester carboxylesterase
MSCFRKSVTMLTGLVFAASVFVIQAGSAGAQTAAAKNIVLVHGAFVDGSVWEGVIARLQGKGYTVTAVQNPMTSLADDVAATQRVLRRQQGPVILVGHSWGGVVITEAAARDPNVVGLVYVAAFPPDAGESLNDLLKLSSTPAPGRSGLQEDQGFLWFDRGTYRAGLAADVDPAKAAVLAAVQQPIAASAFDERVTAPAWKTRPSWYAVAESDAVVPADLQRVLAGKIKAVIRPLPGASHEPMVSQPAAIAELIEEAAAKASSPR